jgi:hypothetical protein
MSLEPTPGKSGIWGSGRGVLRVLEVLRVIRCEISARES